MLISKKIIRSLAVLFMFASVYPSVAADKNQLALYCSKLMHKPEVNIGNDFDLTNGTSISEAVHYLSILENMVHETISEVCELPRSTQMQITVKEPINQWFAKSAGNLELRYLSINTKKSSDLETDIEYHLVAKNGDTFILMIYGEQIYLGMKVF